MFEEIDADILAMPLPKLQKLYQQRRNEARRAMQTFKTEGNKNCWDDAIRTNQNLLPQEEQDVICFGKFNMCSEEILWHCKKWIEFQKRQGNVLPDKKPRLE